DRLPHVLPVDARLVAGPSGREPAGRLALLGPAAGAEVERRRVGTVRRRVRPGQPDPRAGLGGVLRAARLAAAGRRAARPGGAGGGSDARAVGNPQLPRARPADPSEVEPRLRTVPVAVPPARRPDPAADVPPPPLRVRRP